MPRLNPVDLDESGDARATLERIQAERGWLPNLYRTLALSPDLLARFVEMTAALRSSTKLQPSLRELAILVVARALNAEIQWRAHVPLAREAGLDESTIAAIESGTPDLGAAEIERAVAAFAREVTRDAEPNEGTWSALRNALDERELAELTLTVGFYNMVARFLRTAGVNVDPEYSRQQDESQTSSSPE